MSLPPTPAAVVPYPNRIERLQRRHKIISYIKSAVRIVASVAFIVGSAGVGASAWIAGSVLLIIAEIGGIAEEIYGS